MRCRHVGCDSLIHEDTEFTAHMLTYALPQRRYACAMGHSTYTNVPCPALRPQPVANTRPSGALHPRVCYWCQTAFTGRALQKYCSLDCSRAVDADRSRKLREAVRLSDDELRRLRAIPFGPYTPTRSTPIPYAPRSTRLSKSWV